MLIFNTENMNAQEFPFKAPIMDYILKNVSANQLLKLYQTCKFFYNKFKFNIIEDFQICYYKNEERIVGNSLAIYYDNPALAKLENLWISNSFTLADYGHYKLDYGKFSHLTYNNLKMCGNSNPKDFDFLVKPSALRNLYIRDGIYEPESVLSLSYDEIIERAPHVSAFDLWIYQGAELDMTKLISSNRQTKLTSLVLKHVSIIPDPLLVVEYFKKHAIPEIDYYFQFNEGDDDLYDDDEDIQPFYKTINDGLQAWKLFLQLPPTISSSFIIDLTGKTAVVTGASEGIGSAAVILFRQLGASVIAVARNDFQLKSLLNECQNIKNFGFLQVYSIDENEFEPDNVYDRIKCRFGEQLDILVNIADLSGWGGVRNIKLEQNKWLNYHIVLEGHVEMYETAEYFLPEAKGSVINVSYPDGLITKPKHAQLVAKYEREIEDIEDRLSSNAVRINTVNPGAFVSPNRPAGINDIAYQKLVEESKNTYNKQIANAIAFLASDAASINGSILNVNAPNLH